MSTLRQQHPGQRSPWGQWLQRWPFPVEPLRWQERPGWCCAQGGVEFGHLLRLPSLVTWGTTQDCVMVRWPRWCCAQGGVEFGHLLRLPSLVTWGTTQDCVMVCWPCWRCAEGGMEFGHLLYLPSLVTWGTTQDCVMMCWPCCAEGGMDFGHLLHLSSLVARGTTQDCDCVLALLMLCSRGCGIRPSPSSTITGHTRNNARLCDGALASLMLCWRGCGIGPSSSSVIIGHTRNNARLWLSAGLADVVLKGVWNSAIFFIYHHWSPEEQRKTVWWCVGLADVLKGGMDFGCLLYIPSLVTRGTTLDCVNVCWPCWCCALGGVNFRHLLRLHHWSHEEQRKTVWMCIGLVDVVLKGVWNLLIHRCVEPRWKGVWNPALLCLPRLSVARHWARLADSVFTYNCWLYDVIKWVRMALRLKAEPEPWLCVARHWARLSISAHTYNCWLCDVIKWVRMA